MSELQVGDLVEYKTPNGNIYTGIINKLWGNGEYNLKIRRKKIVDDTNYVYTIRSTILVRKNKLTKLPINANMENRMMEEIHYYGDPNYRNAVKRWSKLKTKSKSSKSKSSRRSCRTRKN